MCGEKAMQHHLTGSGQCMEASRALLPPEPSALAGRAHWLTLPSDVLPPIFPHLRDATALGYRQSPSPYSKLTLTSMDFSYGPPPPPRGKRKQTTGPAPKRPRVADFSDLPTHLPNTGSVSPPARDIERSPEEQEHEVKEKEVAVTKEPIYIEGTTITLQTEEDIAKWIEERRKNWPTRKNVELKSKREQEIKPQEPEKPQTKQVCKFYARNKKCKFGNKCRNVHETSKGSGSLTTINGLQVAVPQRYKKEISGTGSLYKNLVQRELYEHENNVIIDFLQYLDKNNLIDRDASI